MRSIRTCNNRRRSKRKYRRYISLPPVPMSWTESYPKEFDRLIQLWSKGLVFGGSTVPDIVSDEEIARVSLFNQHAGVLGRLDPNPHNYKITFIK